MRAEIGVGVGLGLVALAAIGAAAWWLYRRRELFNPASEKNVVNVGASSAVVALTGGAAAGGEDSAGGVLARLREWWSGDDARIRDLLKGSRPAPASSPLGVDAVEPYSLGAP